MSTSPRDQRRAGQRRRRRIESTVLLAVALAAAGALAGALLDRGGSKPPPAAASTTKPKATTTPTTRPAKTHSGAGLSPELQRLIRTGLPLYCGGRSKRVVALTFDDGPGSLSWLALRILRRAHARATFFLVGRNLASWPTFPPQELQLGAIGDHTWNHLDLPQLPVPQMKSEIARTQTAIEQLIGQPVRLFRPPYEAHNAAVDAEVRSLGMLEVLWSIDTQDSEGADWHQIGATVAKDVQPGSIILMHDNRGQTTAALRYRILPTLRRLGLRTVSVPELLATDPPTMAQLHAGYAGCTKPS